MTDRARGPVWHKKQKEQGIIPRGLRGPDTDATWGRSDSDGRVFGHGTFSLVSHGIPVLGCFIYMKNSKNEAKELWFATSHYKGITDYVVTDSEADDSALFRELGRRRKITLITRCRKNMDKSPERPNMIGVMKKPAHQDLYKKRAQTVGPMQGLAEDISESEHCRMRGEKNNRRLFAAMGLAIQMHQLVAYRENRPTWDIKNEVLGL